MAKRRVPPADTWLADFRESAGLTPPPRTLSNAETRLVDLLDEFLYSLRCGWEIPPGFPRDRFVPTVSGKRDLVAPIVQYLIDLGFTGDARRLHDATRRLYEHRDWGSRKMLPSPRDDKGWKEFQQQYVNPLVHHAGSLQAVICDVRQLIIDTGSKDSVDGKPAVVQPAHAVGGRENPKQPTPADTWFTTAPEESGRYKHGPIEGTLKQLEQWLKAGSQPTLRKHNGQSWWYIRKLVGRRYAVWCDSQTKHAEANQRRLEEMNRETKSNEAQSSRMKRK